MPFALLQIFKGWLFPRRRTREGLKNYLEILPENPLKLLGISLKNSRISRQKTAKFFPETASDLWIIEDEIYRKSRRFFLVDGPMDCSKSLRKAEMMRSKK